MDSESTPSQSFTPKDEFEGIEVAEFDANALWELLHDEPMEEEAAGGGGAPEQAKDPNSDTGVESYWCLNDFNNINNNNTIQDIDWFGIMEETSTACSDMGGWYGESCMEEEMNQILETGNYSITHSEILSDEIGYIGLWRDN